MKKYIDKEEKDIIESFENNEWVRAENISELRKIFKNAAKNTLLNWRIRSSR